MIVIQATKDIVLPNGVAIKAGGVVTVPESIGAALIQGGLARLRIAPGPTERKADAGPHTGDPLPDPVPYVRVPAPPATAGSVGAYEDQDNFIRNLVTITAGSVVPITPLDWSGIDVPPVTPSGSASDRPPILTLDQIKTQCHIELDQTDEDALLEQYEMAARIHTENYLRYQIDDTCGENIKQALLMLIAYWYRSRETVSTGRSYIGTPMPLAYEALLALERDYPVY